MFVCIIFINRYVLFFLFLKEYNRRIVKPKTKGELHGRGNQGILENCNHDEVCQVH